MSRSSRADDDERPRAPGDAAPAGPTLALFDLDHTLIPFDSGMAWTRFLVRRGVLPPEAEAVHLAHCRDYAAGTLDIHAMHRALLVPLRRFSAAELAAWLGGFETEMAALLPAEPRGWVRAHRDDGALCVLVTATQRLIATPFARLFGIEHVVASEATLDDGGLTGEIDGDPCYRELKLRRVDTWLAGRGTRLAAFERAWFYSDSATDLPLLRAVSDPVAVNPDARLRVAAAEAGWPVLEAR